MPQPDTTKITDSLTIQIQANQKVLLEPHSEVHKDMYAGTIWGIVLFIFTVIVIWLAVRDKLSNKNNSSWDEIIRNFGWAIVWCILLGVGCYVAFLFGYIHPPVNGFKVSHGDLLLVVASIIAAVGAVWAIYARIDAEKAFKKSEETYKETQKILRLIKSSFEFKDIFKENAGNLPDFFIDIDTGRPLNNFKLILYIGFPCIGYFYNNKEEFSLLDDPEKLFKKLIDFLESLALLYGKKRLKESSIMISVFRKETSDYLLNKYTDGPKKITYDNNPDDLIDDFYSALNKLKSLKCFNHKDENGNIIIIRDGEFAFECDSNGKPLVDQNGQFVTKKDQNGQPIFKESFHLEEKFRFVICEHRDLNKLPRKALIWIVPDLQNNSGKTKSFESAAFQTNDEMFLNVLERIFARN